MVDRQKLVFLLYFLPLSVYEEYVFLVLIIPEIVDEKYFMAEWFITFQSLKYLDIIMR